MITVAKGFIETLVNLEVRYIFGVPSGNWIDYMDIIHQTPDIDFVLVTNEASAAFMADVYWRLSGKLAACFGTFGPGACNLSTGVCGGYLDRSPMLVFTDEVPDHLRNRVSQMNIDHQQLFKPITKWTTSIKPETIVSTLHKAYHLAVSEPPGPVHIGIPAGISATPIPQINTEILAQDSIKDTKNQIKLPIDINALLQRAQKPLIVVGNSANRYRINKEIYQLAEKFSLPVILTPMAKGQFPESHKLYSGVLGHALSDQVAKIHHQADLIIAIGYDPVEINLEDWCSGIPVIDINVCEQFICEKQYPGSVNIVGPMQGTINELKNCFVASFKWDINWVEQTKKEMFAQFESLTSPFHICEVLNIIRQELPEDGIMTCDVGAHLHLIGQQWITPEPETQLMSNGCSSMGFAMPAAIAAKIARNKQKVCCITGDGGFAMMAGELLTALRLKLSVVFIVLVDETLSLIRIKQKNKSFDEENTTLVEKQERLNQYFGVPVQFVDNGDALKKILNRAFNRNGPQLIEIGIKSTDYDQLVLKGNHPVL